MFDSAGFKIFVYIFVNIFILKQLGRYWCKDVCYVLLEFTVHNFCHNCTMHLLSYDVYALSHKNVSFNTSTRCTFRNGPWNEVGVTRDLTANSINYKVVPESQNSKPRNLDL